MTRQTAKSLPTASNVVPSTPSQDSAAGAPTFCVVRHPFTRAISEYAWQAKWTKYWRQCTADNLNEFVQRVFVEGIDPDDEFTHEAQELRRYSTESDEEDPFVALSWYVDNSSRDQHHPTPGEGKRQRA